MRVVMSVLKYADEQSVPVRIIWTSSKECKVFWGELFQPLLHNKVQIHDGSFKESVATKHNLWLPKLLRWGEYDKQIDDFNPNKQSLKELGKKYGSLYISTCYAIGEYDSTMVGKVFVPLPALQEKVAETTKKFTPHTLGVHIRRKDNKQAILHSPLSAFRQRMDAYIALYDDARIFLCTDDLSVKRHFLQLYKDRLLINEVELQRQTCSGMLDAVVDLWCLAKTTMVTGSYFSYFSDTATEIGGQPLETIDVGDRI